MQIDFNPIVLVQFLVLVHGLTTGILLLSSSTEAKHNFWLGCLVLAMTAQTLDSFFNSTGIYRDHHQLYFAPLFYSWAYGPLLYFYLKRLQDPNFVFESKQRWHFLPVLIQFLFYSLIVAQSLDFKTWFWFNVHKPLTRYLDVYVGIVLVFVYLYRSNEALRLEQLRLRRFIYFLAGFYVLAFVDPLINAFYLPASAPRFYLIQYAIPIFTYWLGLSAYFKERKVQQVKAARSEVNPVHLQTIVKVVEEEKLYLNPELSLSHLAEQVKLNTSIVSQAINAGLRLSFNDFINQYRVAHFIQRLQKGDHLQLTLLALALDCGFNSKNTFNRAFRKITGKAPKDFLEEMAEMK
jgi:AraC-like DNA-binding protein